MGVAAIPFGSPALPTLGRQLHLWLSNDRNAGKRNTKMSPQFNLGAQTANRYRALTVYARQC
jgi:hypothetical protein